MSRRDEGPDQDAGAASPHIVVVAQRGAKADEPPRAARAARLARLALLAAAAVPACQRGEQPTVVPNVTSEPGVTRTPPTAPQGVVVEAMPQPHPEAMPLPPPVIAPHPEAMPRPEAMPSPMPPSRPSTAEARPVAPLDTSTQNVIAEAMPPPRGRIPEARSPHAPRYNNGVPGPLAPEGLGTPEAMPLPPPRRK